VRHRRQIARRPAGMAAGTTRPTKASPAGSTSRPEPAPSMASARVSVAAEPPTSTLSTRLESRDSVRSSSSSWSALRQVKAALARSRDRSKTAPLDATAVRNSSMRAVPVRPFSYHRLRRNVDGTSCLDCASAPQLVKGTHAGRADDADLDFTPSAATHWSRSGYGLTRRRAGRPDHRAPHSRARAAPVQHPSKRPRRRNRPGLAGRLSNEGGPPAFDVEPWSPGPRCPSRRHGLRVVRS
jgi:hypothetical protein